MEDGEAVNRLLRLPLRNLSLRYSDDMSSDD
jgi:hypothetical protein